MDIDDLQGLTTTKVTTLRQSQGYNELPDREKKNFVKIIFEVLREPMIFY